MLFFQLQLIPEGKSPLPLRVIYLSATGFPEFGMLSPTVFSCVLPWIGYNCASGLLSNLVPVAAYTYAAYAVIDFPSLALTAIVPAVLACSAVASSLKRNLT